MVLDLRQKQTECIIRMLNLNRAANATTDAANEEIFKILIYDKFCQNILSPLIHVKDLRKHGVTLFFLIDKDRKPVPDVPAVYFVQPSEANIHRIVADATHGLYDVLHLNFSSSIPRPLLEHLASATLQSESIHRISGVHDQYSEFVSLEDDLFSLSQKSCFVQLNDPSAGDREIASVIEGIVDGLFCVLASLVIVPIIACPLGGAAQMVASALDRKLRDHLSSSSKNNLFSEGGSFFLSSFQRPILCIFDRNFEMSASIQHDFRYRPLVHDVLGLKLNKLSVRGETGGTRSYELDHSDPFWVENGSLEFPDVALEIETQLSKYKKDIEDVNRRAGRADDGAGLASNTKHLMNAVNSLPELTERKKIIDKHTNIATMLLGEIKERSLDAYAKKENAMMNRGGGMDRNELAGLLKGRGSKMDKLRFAIMHLISSETANQLELETVESALKECEIDACALQYVKRLRSLTISLASANPAATSNFVDWAGRFYGQSLSAVTAGVRNLLSGDRQLALTTAVETLMEGKLNPEIDSSYLVLDPRAPPSGSTNSHQKGPFREAIVFMIGGGNYVEYSSLKEFALRQQQQPQLQQPARRIIYGATEILTGEEFVEQLTLLGHKMGLGGTHCTSSSP